MVKITPFNYIVINRISDKITHVMMPITKEEDDKLNDIIANNSKKDTNCFIELNGFVINCENIVMYGETYSDIHTVETTIDRIIPDMVSAPGHIDKDNLKVSLEMVVGCTTKRFYDYYCTLIGNPKNIIIFKHYGSFN